MAEAMQRKKEGYGWIDTQVVWGKEFKGTAFVPSEKGRDITAIEFKDFEPGKVYKRKVTLTNASYAFNTFKLMSLPDAVKDFFDISYTHPGALSPGRACWFCWVPCFGHSGLDNWVWGVRGGSLGIVGVGFGG